MADVFTGHGFGHLNIYLFICFCSNEIYFQAADFADGYIIAATEQFKVYDIFQHVAAVPISETEQIVPESDVHNIVFSKCPEKFLSFQIESFNIIEKVGFQ